MVGHAIKQHHVASYCTCYSLIVERHPDEALILDVCHCMGPYASGGYGTVKESVKLGWAALDIWFFTHH